VIANICHDFEHIKFWNFNKKEPHKHIIFAQEINEDDQEDRAAKKMMHKMKNFEKN
jgi:hypothetical protein